ncbi:MAG: chemotaxis protein CheW [Myxococcales bacterium]|nr:chemotaxis protein CheW [Myxococcales bacterium]
MTPASIEKLAELKARLAEIHALEQQARELKNALVKEGALSRDEALDKLDFLLLQSADQVLALPLTYVTEVIDMPLLRPLPAPRPPVSGLVNYHGDYLAVIDIRPLVGQPETAARPHQVLAICEVAPKRFALKADDVHEVITVATEAISIADHVLPGVLHQAGMLRINAHQSAVILNLPHIALTTPLPNDEPTVPAET